MRQWMLRYWQAYCAVPDGRSNNIFALVMVVYGYILGHQGGGILQYLLFAVGVGLMVMRLIARWDSDK